MFHINKEIYQTKQALYKDLIFQVKGIIEGEKDLIANLANVSSLIYHFLDNVNWAGFYLYKENQLVLGPFHGKPACIRINLGKGVCGTAALYKTSQVVKDVHQFEGHIACDGETNSEIVIPMAINDKLIGVLDIDSTEFDKFDETDKKYLEQLVAELIEQCNV